MKYHNQFHWKFYVENTLTIETNNYKIEEGLPKERGVKRTKEMKIRNVWSCTQKGTMVAHRVRYNPKVYTF